VRIAFEALDPRILPDMGVKVTFLKEDDEAAAPAARPATLVPKAAVQSDNTNSFVYVVAGDTVERRAVKVGGADGDRVEVLADLRAGDRVVVSPLQNMTDRAKVVVK
jgi:HlyD family secretion protein